MSAIVLKSTEGLSHKDWLAYRNMGIGGSDASVVCGVNRWKSAIELWSEKTSRTPPEEAGEAAYWGTRLEPLVREEFSRRTGLKIITVNQILRSKEYPFMLANLDGVCRCPKYGRCIFEAKTANAFKSSEWENDSVPREYVMQIQHYLCVTGYNGAYIAVLVGGNRFQWKFVPRDEELITMLIRCERDFWKHVQENVPPPPDGSDACANFLAGLYPNCTPKSKIELPVAADGWIHQYTTASEQLEIFKARKQEAANHLKLMLGENEIGIAGNGYVKWPAVTQERFNSKLFETEQPELYAKYAIKSTHRRFTVKAASRVNENATTCEQLYREAG